jgi:hypothetical protein
MSQIGEETERSYIRKAKTFSGEALRRATLSG